MRRFSTLIAGLAGLLVLSGPVAHAQPPHAKGVSLETWSLKNGLNVVFAARQGAPLVSVEIVYHVGSRDEKPGSRGLARMLRELMFRGSTRVKPGGHRHLVARIGGRTGGDGNEDVTSVYTTVPAPYLTLALELEADRMTGLQFTDEAVLAVRQSVMNARQREVDANALGKSIELLRGQVFGRHPYANGTTGAAPDMRRLSRADCLAFYRAYFSPNNATLVIAGAVSSDLVHRLVEAQFASLPSVAKLPAREEFNPSSALEAKTLRLPIQRPMVALAAPLPRLSPKEHATVLVLAEVLQGGSAGRLSRELVGPRAPALAAGGAPLILENGGMWVFFAIHEASQTSETLRRALMDEIVRVREKPIDVEALAEARLRAAATLAGRLSTTEGLASSLGLAASIDGSPEQALLRPQQILDVSQTDIGRVANEYLREDRLTVLLLSPEGRSSTAGVAP